MEKHFAKPNPIILLALGALFVASLLFFFIVSAFFWHYKDIASATLFLSVAAFIFYLGTLLSKVARAREEYIPWWKNFLIIFALMFIWISILELVSTPLKIILGTVATTIFGIFGILCVFAFIFYSIRLLDKYAQNNRKSENPS